MILALLFAVINCHNYLPSRLFKTMIVVQGITNTAITKTFHCTSTILVFRNFGYVRSI